MNPRFSLIRRLLLTAGLTLASLGAQAGAYDDLIAAVYRDDSDTVIALIKRGLDVNSVDPAGNTLLHVAARNGNAGLLEFLLSHNANPQVRNRVGDTALLLAVYNNRLAAVEKLLAGGGELNPKGWTPLHYAVFAGHADMVKYLLEKGANIDARAPNEQTALMLAAKAGNQQIAKVLLQAKADAALKDQHGETALTLAQKGNNTDIARLLEQHANPEPSEAATKPAPPATPSLPDPVEQAPAAQPFMTERY